MDTPSNSPRKDWNALTAAARKARPPADIDVRFGVMRAIEAEAAAALPQRGMTLWDELAALAGSAWMRGLLGGGAVAAVAVAALAVQGSQELLDVMRLGGPTFSGF